MISASSVSCAASPTEMLTWAAPELRVLFHDNSLCEQSWTLTSVQLLTYYRYRRKCICSKKLGRSPRRPLLHQVTSCGKYHILELLKAPQADKQAISARTNHHAVVDWCRKGFRPHSLLAGLPRLDLDAHCVHRSYHMHHSFSTLIAHRLLRHVCTIDRLFIS